MNLPTGYGQVIYDGYRRRAREKVGDDVLAQSWSELTPDDQQCWDGAAQDLDDYLRRVPG